MAIVQISITLNVKIKSIPLLIKIHFDDTLDNLLLEYG
jgi:hypothetical protein